MFLKCENNASKALGIIAKIFDVCFIFKNYYQKIGKWQGVVVFQSLQRLRLLLKEEMFEMFEMFTIILSPKTLNIESKAIFIFSFCIGLVTQLNGSVLGVLKDNYVIKRTRKLAFGNSGFLIQNLLKPTTLLYGYKRNLPFVD